MSLHIRSAQHQNGIEMVVPVSVLTSNGQTEAAAATSSEVSLLLQPAGSSPRHSKEPAEDLSEQDLHLSKDGRQSTPLKAAGNLYISFVGAGILGLPHAFALSGLAVSILMLVIIGAMGLHCMLLLVQCKRRLEPRGVVSFSEVARTTLGIHGQRLVESLLVLSQTGFCVAYLVFIGQNMATFTRLASAWYIAFCLPALLSLAMLKGVTALAPFSLVADVANIAGAMVVLSDDAMAFRRHEHFYYFTTMWSLPYLFGVAIYCFEGIGMILPIEASMKDRAKFPWVLTAVMAGVTLLFTTFGSIGYMAFGEHTKDIITMNLPDNWTTTAVKLSLCVGLLFTFPIMLVPVYEIVERGLLSKEWFDRTVGPRQRWVCFRCLRACLVVLIGLAAMLVPGFGIFISLIGSLSCATLSFTIPAMCHTALFYRELAWWQLAKNGLMIVLGIVGAAVGVTDSVRNLIAVLHGHGGPA